MTSTAIARPVSDGASSSRSLDGSGFEPSSAMLHQSMAYRKQTTERPAKTPMNTDKMRKKRSSRNTERHTTPGVKPSRGTASSTCAASASATCCNCGSVLSSVLLVQAGDQKESAIGLGLRAAMACRFLLNLENQIHGGVGEVGIVAQIAPPYLRLELRQLLRIAFFERVGRFAGVQPAACRRKTGAHQPVALRLLELGPEGIPVQDKFRHPEPVVGVLVPRRNRQRFSEIPLRILIPCEPEGRLASAGQGRSVMRVEFDAFAIGGKRALVVAHANKHLPKLQLFAGLVAHACGQVDQLGFSLRTGVNAHQVRDQLPPH